MEDIRQMMKTLCYGRCNSIKSMKPQEQGAGGADTGNRGQKWNEGLNNGSLTRKT